jgi:AcrR family transcriptional regulator
MSPRPRTRNLRRGQIARAALELIAERGFQDMRVADVAARAGTTASGVLYHFESKEEMLDAAVSLAEDSFYAEVDAATTLDSAAERLVRLLERGGRNDTPGTVATWKVWLEIWVRALRERHTARTRRILDQRWRRTLAAVIRDGQARGEFAVAADPELVALQLASLMDGLAIQFALGDPEVSGRRMTEVLIATAEQALGCELGRYIDTSAPAVKAAETK